MPGFPVDGHKCRDHHMRLVTFLVSVLIRAIVTYSYGQPELKIACGHRSITVQNLIWTAQSMICMVIVSGQKVLHKKEPEIKFSHSLGKRDTRRAGKQLSRSRDPSDCAESAISFLQKLGVRIACAESFATFPSSFLRCSSDLASC